MTDTAVGVEEFKSLMEKKAELTKKIKEEAKDVFAKSSKDIFTKHGSILGRFGWTQYTPYFNDGDPCTFGANEVFIHTPEDVENEDLGYWESSDEFTTYSTNGNKLSKVLYEWKDQDYTTAYKPGGDYVEIENENYDPTYGEAYAAINDLMDLLDEDTLEDLFGDHVVILVTADGVSVEDYEHE